MNASTSAVVMTGITKRFPGVLANDQVDFTLRQGEVHALLGENGAGKSTLMSILAGIYRPDAGRIRIAGEEVSFRSPADAIVCGIGCVYQHFMLVPSLTVTENIILGLAKPRWRLHLDEAERKVSDLANCFGMAIDPRARIWQLSVGEQQRVEILKMLYRGVQILILDEPTAVLTPQEGRQLFHTLRSMVRDGLSVVLISHKLGETLEVAERFTVLRAGRVTAAGMEAGSVSPRQLAHLMIGRELLPPPERVLRPAGEPVLQVSDLHALGDRGLAALRGISLAVAAGEIVGIAGVSGNGQSELAQAVTGLRQPLRGEVRICGQSLAGAGPLKAIDLAVSHVPEDRAGVGTAPNLSVLENLIMKSYRRPPLSRGFRLNGRAARAYASELKKRFEIAAPGIDTPSRLLSGGNLQRLILAREISAQPRLIVAVHPTRGLDIGATEVVHRLLLEQRGTGTAILLISEDLEELLAISDRIAVMYGGKIVGEMKSAEADLDQIGWMMSGAQS